MKPINYSFKRTIHSWFGISDGLLIFLFFLFLFSCQKDEENLLNQKSTNGINITPFSPASCKTSVLYYGHQIFRRVHGKPFVETQKIENPDFELFNDNFVLMILNGDNKKTRVSSAEIWIDGILIVGPSDFSKKISFITKPISGLTPESVLEVKLNGAPGSFIDLWIEGNLKPDNVALNKPTTSQSFQSGQESSKANDADGTNNSFWSANPYSQWWKVDLGAIYDLTSIVIRNYFDGTRYYQYFILVSTDDITYTQVVSKVNRNIATDAGDTYSISAAVRYIKVNMTYNSANMGVQISDFRAYGTLTTGLPTYTLISSAGTNGLINPSGTVIVSQNTRQVYIISANIGYKIADVLVDGVSVGAVSLYIFNSVTANHTIAATFSVLNTYTITSNTGTGGTITPLGEVTVNQGTTQTYMIAPNNGYQISAVTVDNVSVGPISSYTFNNINANHTIAATFSPFFTITARAGPGGTINPSGAVIVGQGGNQTFTIAANTGYQIADVMVDNVSVGAVSTYPFNNVASNHTIRVTFSNIGK
jgi:hypothetical protein